MPVPILNTLLQLGTSSAATSGGAVGSGSAIGGGGIFNQLSGLLKKGGIAEVEKSIAGSLNKASNIGLSIPTAFSNPQIDPGLGSKIDKSTFDFSALADSIIEQSGLGDLMKEFKTAETAETKKSAKTKETKTTVTSPTQETNKPVEKASQSREESRTNLEQLFLDLINGKLDIKL